MKRNSGLFITFEGTEGAGKSTLIRAIAERLKAKKVKYTITREPGGHAVAEKIRNLILADQMDPWTELFLYEAARAEHVSQTLLPALLKGHMVLCDRYADSSLAYQSHARGLPWKSVMAMNRIATRGLTPDLTLLLDMDPAQALKRADDRNRFEAEGVAFQRKVRQGFLKAMKQDPKRWLKLDVRKSSPAQLADQVIERLQRKFKKFPRLANG